MGEGVVGEAVMGDAVVGDGPSDSSAAAGRRLRLRVANWNLMWRFASLERRLPVLCERLQRLSPDMVAVQECSPDQADALSDALGMEAHYVGAPLGRGGAEMGNAVLARVPLTARTHRWLPMVEAEDMRRVVVAARLDCDGTALWLASVHLTRTPDAGGTALGLTGVPPGELAARTAQIADLCTFVDAMNEPAVVAGDLAFLPDSTEYRLLVAGGFRDAWRAGPRLGSRVTTPADCPYLAAEMDRYRSAARSAGVELPDPGFCLDYQFVFGEAVEVGMAWTFGRPDGEHGGEVWPSDHLGVCVEYHIAAGGV